MQQKIGEQTSLAIHRLNEKCKLAQNFPELMAKTASAKHDESFASSAVTEETKSVNSQKTQRGKKINAKLMMQAMVLGLSKPVESMVTGLSNNEIKVP